MLQKKLEFIFASVIVIAMSILATNYYKEYSFTHNEIPQSYKERISQKVQDILERMQMNFGFRVEVPIVVTDKIKGRLYGFTSYDNGQITIYLNKNVMRESMDYMIDSVIAHEYAHALMFKFNPYYISQGGHSKEWQSICQKLGGVDCQQYVNQHEIIMSKLPFK